jgi:hypothetical protein
LTVTARGLTTGLMHCGPPERRSATGAAKGDPKGDPKSVPASTQRSTGRGFQLDLDFVGHTLEVATTDGGRRSIALRPRSVADLYRELFEHLRDLGIEVHIRPEPSEIGEDAIPLDRDEEHAAYDPDAANRFWRVLVQCERVMTEFRASFLGKCSPVHFFWGSFDLAVTRFSGRPAPPHAPIPYLPDQVAKDAYSHELSSAGFWPGSRLVPYPAFFGYAYPEPEGFRDAEVGPEGAFYHPDLGEFLLPYEVVRTASDPDAALMEFLQSTYAAAADLGRWDRRSLEREPEPG